VCLLSKGQKIKKVNFNMEIQIKPVSPAFGPGFDTGLKPAFEPGLESMLN
jgi:hypothetical protein